MNIVLLSLSDILAAVERLRNNAAIEGDVQAVAAWAVANFDKVAGNAGAVCSACGGSGVYAANRNAAITTNSVCMSCTGGEVNGGGNVCGFCGMDSRGL